MTDERAYQIAVNRPSPDVVAGRKFSAVGSSGGRPAEIGDPLTTRDFWARFPRARPRWQGEDTSLCVAALDLDSNENGWSRFAAGAVRRKEQALAITSIPEFNPSIRSPVRYFDNAVVLGEPSPVGVQVSVAEGVTSVEMDLARRLKSTGSPHWVEMAMHAGARGGRSSSR